jgi:hypothetical protein
MSEFAAGTPEFRAGEVIAALSARNESITVHGVRRLAGVSTAVAAHAVKSYKLTVGVPKIDVPAPRPDDELLHQLWRAACHAVLSKTYINEYIRQSESIISELIADTDYGRRQLEADYQDQITKLSAEVESLKEERKQDKAIIAALAGRGEPN